MTHFNQAFAERIVREQNLEASNLALAEYWLSLWSGDALPLRAKLNPAQLKSYLPNLLLFDVVPDESVTVRLAGTRYVQLLGTELTGKDWLSFAPQDYRAERLRIFSAITRGAVAIGHRRIALAHGKDPVSEEILLPFAKEPSSDAHPVLVHVNWKPEEFQKVQSIAQATGDPIDFKIVALR